MSERDAAELREIAAMIRAAVLRLNRVFDDLSPIARSQVDKAVGDLDVKMADDLETTSWGLPL